MKPTRSANRTETSRRSAAGASRARAAAAPGPAWAEAGAPHSPQNFSLPARAAPHDPHESASGVPHSMQNFFPCGFSAAQLGQIMWGVSLPLRFCPPSPHSGRELEDAREPIGPCGHASSLRRGRVGREADVVGFYTTDASPRTHGISPIRSRDRRATPGLVTPAGLRRGQGMSSGQELREPLERCLVSLVCSTAMVSCVLGHLVGDPGLVEVVAEEPVAPVQVVVVVRACVEQDAG